MEMMKSSKVRWVLVGLIYTDPTSWSVVERAICMSCNWKKLKASDLQTSFLHPQPTQTCDFAEGLDSSGTTWSPESRSLCSVLPVQGSTGIPTEQRSEKGGSRMTKAWCTASWGEVPPSRCHGKNMEWRALVAHPSSLTRCWEDRGLGTTGNNCICCTPRQCLRNCACTFLFTLYKS